MIIYVTERNQTRELTISGKMTVEALLKKLGYTKFIAVWVNDRQTMYGDYRTAELADRDRVLIIKPLSGG